jgi:hypothetical protein
MEKKIITEEMATNSRRNWLTAIGLGSFGFALMKVLPFSRANLINDHNDLSSAIVIKSHPMAVRRNNRGNA